MSNARMGIRVAGGDAGPRVGVDEQLGVRATDFALGHAAGIDVQHAVDHLVLSQQHGTHTLLRETHVAVGVFPKQHEP